MNKKKIRKQSAVLKLAGTLKPKKKINLDKIRDQIDYSRADQEDRKRISNIEREIAKVRSNL